MSTPDYIAQPDFSHQSNLTSSSRILMANRTLRALPEKDLSQTQSFNSDHRRDILNAFLSYLRSLHAGYRAVHLGTYSPPTSHESKDKYVDASTVLGYEANLGMFLVQLDNYSKTVERIISCEECSEEEMGKLESFVLRLTKDNNKSKPITFHH